MLQNGRRWVLLVIVELVVAMVFVGVGNNGFVWDDNDQVVNNDLITDWQNVGQAFSGKTTFADYGERESTHNYYRPVVLVWWMVNALVWGGVKAREFHLTQLGLHMVNVGLVYGLVRLVEGEWGRRNVSGWVAVWVALLWGIHPGNVESVANISAVQELLFGFFGLVGLLGLVKGKGKKVNWWVVAGGWLIAALAKEPGLLVPVVGWLLVQWVMGVGTGMVGKIMAGVWGGYVVLRVGVAGVGWANRFSVVPIARADWGERMLTVPYVLFQHLRVMFFPKDLFLGDNLVVRQVSGEWGVRFLVVAGYVGLMWWVLTRNKDKVSMWLFGWWVVAVLVVANVIPLDATFAERWLYWPLIPTVWFWMRTTSKPRRWVWLLASLVVVLGWRSVVRVRDWQSDLTLSSHDVQYDVGGYQLANNMGWELYKLGHKHEAKQWLETSVRMNPEWWVAYNNLGVYYHEENEVAEAEAMYKLSIEKGNYVLAWENLSLLYWFAEDSRFRQTVEEGLKYFPRNEKLLSLARR